MCLMPLKWHLVSITVTRSTYLIIATLIEIEEKEKETLEETPTFLKCFSIYYRYIHLRVVNK